MYLLPQNAMAFPAGRKSMRRARSLSYVRRSRGRRLSFLSATTSVPPIALASMPPNVAAAMQQLNIPTNDWMYNWTVDAIEEGYLPDYEPGVLKGNVAQFTGDGSGCKTSTSTLKAQLTSTIGSGALTVGTEMLGPSAIIPGGAIVAGIVIGAGAILEGISAIFGHHSRAVAKERGTLCAAVPMANATLQALDEYLAAGQITAATAESALQSLQSSFAQETSAITNTRQMNEGAIYNRALKGIVARRILDLQAAASGARGTAEEISLSTGVPPIWMLLASAALLYFVL